MVPSTWSCRCSHTEAWGTVGVIMSFDRHLWTIYNVTLHRALDITMHTFTIEVADSLVHLTHIKGCYVHLSNAKGHDSMLVFNALGIKTPFCCTAELLHRGSQMNICHGTAPTPRYISFHAFVLPHQAHIRKTFHVKEVTSLENQKPGYS